MRIFGLGIMAASFAVHVPWGVIIFVGLPLIIDGFIMLGKAIEESRNVRS